MEFNIRRAVKSAGGCIDGNFRFSIMWNDRDTRASVDLDAHAIQPDGAHIYYGSYKKPSITSMSGQLDIDMIRPRGVGVENIYWTDLSKLQDGEYIFFIRNYDGNRNNGCKAELFFKGTLYQYYIPHDIVRTSTDDNVPDVELVRVTLKDRRTVKIQHSKYLINTLNVLDLPPMSREELDNVIDRTHTN